MPILTLYCLPSFCSYPLDYQFSSKFDDWDTSEPSQDVIDESDAGSHGNRYTGALRSAVAWVGGLLVRR